MAEQDLDAIRQMRMQQMQQQQGASGGGGAANQQQQQERQKQQQEMKNIMLAQLLTQDARARLNTIATAKPEKAKMIEDMIIRMAQQGQIGGKLDESAFVRVLEQVNQKTQQATKVHFDRRRAAIDSDDDDDF